jgi:hypothetical protein
MTLSPLMSPKKFSLTNSSVALRAELTTVGRARSEESP